VGLTTVRALEKTGKPLDARHIFCKIEFCREVPDDGTRSNDTSDRE
jgi:hypothetical protein